MVVVVAKKNKEFENGHEEAKRRRILEEYPDISKDTLEFVLSLPVEQKIPKVNEKETVYCNSRAARRNGKIAKEKILINHFFPLIERSIYIS